MYVFLIIIEWLKNSYACVLCMSLKNHALNVFSKQLCQMYHSLVIEIMSKVYFARACKVRTCDRPFNMLIYWLGEEKKQYPEPEQYLIGQDNHWEVSESRD